MNLEELKEYMEDRVHAKHHKFITYNTYHKDKPKAFLKLGSDKRANFIYLDGVLIIAGNHCIIDIGENCTLICGNNCDILSGANCRFYSSFACSFDTGTGCDFKETGNNSQYFINGSGDKVTDNWLIKNTRWFKRVK